MRLPFTTEPADFLERPNRYLVVVRLDNGSVVRAHCPDPGRLRELLLPGVRVHVSPAAREERRTTHDLRFVADPVSGTLISLDSRLPNALFREGLEQAWFEPFRGYDRFDREVAIPSPSVGVRSRIDYVLYSGEHRCWVEVKSATLVENGEAYFPDAVTERGKRHVEELADLVRSGERAAVCFIVQRPDAACLRPQWDRDPAFAQALTDAETAGVALFAWTVHLTLHEARLAGRIPVLTERYSWRTAAADL